MSCWAATGEGETRKATAAAKAAACLRLVIVGAEEDKESVMGGN